MIEKNTTLMYGSGGCLEENTLVNYTITKGGAHEISRIGNTIKELHNEFHDPFKSKDNIFKVFCVNKLEQITTIKVKNVIYSGELEVYKVTTIGGDCITATLDHKFKTLIGYVPLKELDSGVVVYVDNKFKTNFEKLSGTIVHNKITKIATIMKVGAAHTYDVMCEDPYHNFIANNFVVHNSGKTVATVSLLKLVDKYPGIKLRYVVTERNSLLGIRDGLKIHNITLKPEQLTYALLSPDKKDYPNPTALVKNYEENFHKKSNKEAKTVKTTGDHRSRFNAFLKVSKGLADYKGIDYLTKEKVNYGSYLAWDNNVVLILDSLTSVIEGLIEETLANRIAVTQEDYGLVQNNLMTMVIRRLTELTQCSVIMIGHPALSDDPNVTQPTTEDMRNGAHRIQKLYPKTFGVKLNEIVPSKFSDTIYQYIDNGKYYWCGYKRGVMTSVRNIPKKDKLNPDFSDKQYSFFTL